MVQYFNKHMFLDPNVTFDDNGKLYGNSANCKFAFAGKKKYFVKVQISPMADDINIDSVVGKVLNDVIKEYPTLRDCTPTYIDCCQVYVDYNENVHGVYPTDQSIKVFTCKSSIQEALPEPLAVCDMKIATLEGAHFESINAFTDALGTLFKQIHKLGFLCGFVHNDAHLGNIQGFKDKDNITYKLNFIDLGRVGLIEEGKNVSNALEKVVEKTMEPDSYMDNYIENLTREILHNDYYIPATKSSFVFDISTIVLGVFEILGKEQLQIYIADFNTRLKTVVSAVSAVSDVPELNFKFIDRVITINNRDVKINQIVMSSIQNLHAIAEFMSPPGSPPANITPFDRYVIAGLIVFAYVSIRNGATNNKINTSGTAEFYFDQLVRDRIMWKCYQYVNPVTTGFCKEVGWLCHRVLQPGKDKYPKFNAGLLFSGNWLLGTQGAGSKKKGKSGGLGLGLGKTQPNGKTQPDLAKILNQGKTLEAQDKMEEQIDINQMSGYEKQYWLALAAGDRTPPRPLPGTKPKPEPTPAIHTSEVLKMLPEPLDPNPNLFKAA